MKLSHLRIQNFKGIANLDIDFTDELGRIRDLTLLVGPNGSGKSAILDAIWFGLQGAIGYANLRQSFRPESEHIVRQGQKFAFVEYQLAMISGSEIDTFLKLQDIFKNIKNISPLQYTTIAWTYPEQQNYTNHTIFGHEITGSGGYDRNPSDILWLYHLYHQKDFVKALGSEEISNIGTIHLFEQERRINSDPVFSTPKLSDYVTLENFNVREVLIDFGIKETYGKSSENRSLYSRVQEAYNFICQPRKMGKIFVLNEESEFDIEFFDEKGAPYGFDGLSSGERSVLNFLVQYFAKRMKNSIILIDELELYLHPDWQFRLLQSLIRMNDGNQFIIATHSPTLLQYASKGSVIELGLLDAQIPDWQLAAVGEDEE